MAPEIGDLGGMAKGRYHHGDLRAALVAAARRLVEEKGPERLTISDAARATGVSTAAPYRHFADRDALLEAVVAEAMERHRLAMQEAADRHPVGSAAAVAAIGRAYVAFAVGEPGLFKVMFSLTRTHGHNSELVARGRASFGVLLAHLANRIGAPPDDPAVRARGLQLWAFVHGLAFLLIDDKMRAMELPLDLDALIADASRRFLGEEPAAAD